LFTTRPQLEGTFGMVAGTHWLATAAGMRILEAGGNAFDAAVAAGFVHQVVEPHQNGLGGDLSLLGYSARDEAPFVVCGQGPAPAAATLHHFAGLGLDLVPGTGLLPACVPGAFGAWLELLSRYGTMRPADVLAPAIEYADGGHPVTESLGDTLAEVEPLFRDHWHSSAAVYLQGDGVPRRGQRLRNPDLARTYRRLVDAAEAAGSGREEQIERARQAFYEGFVAEAISEFCETAEVLDTTGVPQRGLLRYDDLAAFRASVEAPVTVDYHGHTVCKTGPWGQGPVFCQQLAILAGIDLDDTDPAGDELIHVVVEAAKLAFADREAYYGDPDFVDVPLDTLLSTSYNDERRSLLSADASGELRPGTPEGREPMIPRPGKAAAGRPAGVGEPTRSAARSPTTALQGPQDGDTCHLDVVDRWGNHVSATPSGGWLQSSPVVPGLGFSLTTRGQMFWLVDGHPNALAPGKRPRTTLTPTLVLRDGRPCLAFGTPGGDSQDQWSMCFFLRHLHHGLDLQAAIDAPTWQTTHFASSFYPRDSHPRHIQVEQRVAPDAVDRLRRRGHVVAVEDPWTLGRVSAVGTHREGFLLAAADPRGGSGYAAGR
jgi:gamma-glutamyltranspeptidase/glutathione hydrolase